MSSYMKMRPASTRSFGDQSRTAVNKSKRERFTFVDGQYANFYPREDKSLWVAICPDQTWDYEIYDRETEEVVMQREQYHFHYVKHYIPRSKQNFTCSAGARRDKPCYGCAVRNRFYDRKRADDERKGVKTKGEAPISAMSQFATAVVLLEQIAKVPALDNNKKQRMTKDNKPIMRDVPLALMDLKEREKAKKSGDLSFGLRQHWSLGTSNLQELLNFDEELKNNCANCAASLKCVDFACPECCDTVRVANDEDNPLMEQDLTEMRQELFDCACGYKGPFVPVLICDCGEPEQGCLTAFAFRIKTVTTSENKKKLEIVGLKPLSKVIAEHPAVEEMLSKPLELDKIFSPTPLTVQTKRIPEELTENLSPAPRSKKKGSSSEDDAPAESYEYGGGGDSDSTEESED